MNGKIVGFVGFVGVFFVLREHEHRVGVRVLGKSPTKPTKPQSPWSWRIIFHLRNPPYETPFETPIRTSVDNFSEGHPPVLGDPCYARRDGRNSHLQTERLGVPASTLCAGRDLLAMWGVWTPLAQDFTASRRKRAPLWLRLALSGGGPTCWKSMKP